MFRKIFLAIIAVSMSLGAYAADEVTIAAGAGYKNLVNDLSAFCEEKEGIKTNKSFGNLGQIVAQIKSTGLIPVVVGDKSFFDKSDIKFSEEIPVGKGRLVLAWKKGIDIKNVSDITTDKVKRLAIPNVQNAIYGIAGTQYLESSKLAPAVKDKLMVVSSVPQVSSYLVTGEVDAGFSNLTDTLAIADKIGGYIVINEGYEDILIISGFVDGLGSPAVDKFKSCLKDPKAAEIAAKHGL